MKLDLIAFIKTPISTISKLFVDGAFECYVLEDTDRGLQNGMTPFYINQVKQKGKTAIPAGYYEIVITQSNRFKRPLPLLLNVKGFEGIRIHPGNTAEHTEGCLLPGKTFRANFVGQSKLAFEALFEKLKNAKGKIIININRTIKK